MVVGGEPRVEDDPIVPEAEVTLLIEVSLLTYMGNMGIIGGCTDHDHSC